MPDESLGQCMFGSHPRSLTARCSNPAMRVDATGAWCDKHGPGRELVTTIMQV